MNAQANEWTNGRRNKQSDSLMVSRKTNKQMNTFKFNLELQHIIHRT